jgi:phospholipid/cholesterol/gamma-HCH transport system substrate-binding protein
MSAPGKSKTKGRIAGLVFFLVIAMFIAFSILTFNKVFRDVGRITVITTDLGNALASDADVKVRGIIIGEVRGFTPQDGQVAIDLAIDADQMKLIPANATVRLMPKTLFGERYVEVVIPEDAAPPIEPGGVLLQDTSGNTIDAAKMYDTFHDLLTAVPPQDLAVTLGALNQAFSGRGEKLGNMIDRFTEMVTGYNRELPNLEQTLQDFATFADTYSEAGPLLLQALDDFHTTNRTIIDDRPAIDGMLESVRIASSDARSFLNVNGDRLVSITADSRETLEVFARYSPAYVCGLQHFGRHKVEAERAISAVGDTPGIRGNVTIVNPRGAYLPNQDEPRMFDTRGPYCYQPSPDRFPQYPGGSANDGSYQIPSRNPGPSTLDYLPDPLGAPGRLYDPSGTEAERSAVSVIYGAATGRTPNDIPGWVTGIGAPALRGAEVQVR